MQSLGPKGPKLMATSGRRPTSHAIRSVTKINKAKEGFVRASLGSCGNYQNKFWREMEIILPSKSDQKTNRLIDHFGINIDPKDTAAHIISFLLILGRSKQMNCQRMIKERGEPMARVQTAKRTCPIPTLHQISGFKPFTQIQVHNKFFAMAKVKTSVLKDISSKLLRDAHCHLVMLLTHFSNPSITMGVFLDNWKVADIMPIPKLSHPHTTKKQG